MSNVEPLAVTVRGTLPQDTPPSLVLPHEHLIFNLVCRHRAPSSLSLHALRDAPITLGALAQLRQHSLTSLTNLRSPPIDVIVAELKACASLLGGSQPSVIVVDATATAQEGRDPERLLALSELSGVHVVMAAGLPERLAAAATTSTAEEEDEAVAELANSLVSELEDGIEVRAGVRVRAGLLSAGEALPLRPPAIPLHARMLRSLAQAQMRTTAPLLCPLPATAAVSEGAPIGAAEAAAETAAESAAQAVRLLSEGGADAAAIVVGHAQHLLPESGELRPLRRLLAMGVSLSFDGLGNSWSVAGARPADDEMALPPSEERLARAVARLVADGYGGQLVLSHCVSSQLQLQAMGGGGFSHVLRSFVPRLRRLGVDAAAEGLLTQANAWRLLRWSRPAGPPARLMKAWECDACHRRFDEAVNASDTLPTDRVYYEKHAFRYCSTACLSAHRKAGFAQPFSSPAPD